MSNDEEKELEANIYAAEAFIPRQIWKSSDAYRTRKHEAVIQLADTLMIHPAIVAGRIQRETSNYRILKELSGVSGIGKLLQVSTQGDDRMKRVIYSPILKSKRGEAKSLQHLAAPVKARIIPFFDILALKPGTQNGREVEAHLIKQALTVASGLKQQGICYVDLFDINPLARGLEGKHPVTIVHNRLAAEQVRAIPVIGLERDVQYKLSIRAVTGKFDKALDALQAITLDADAPHNLRQRAEILLAVVRSGPAGAKP